MITKFNPFTGDGEPMLKKIKLEEPDPDEMPQVSSDEG